jgi:FkbM family methyltransferase
MKANALYDLASSIRNSVLIKMSKLLEKLICFYGRRFPMDRGKLRIIDTFWRSCVSGEDYSRIATLQYGKLRMKCDLRWFLQRQYYFCGTYLQEREILDLWGQLASGASTVLDVGANTGIYSLAAKAANPAVQVHAFEPTPAIVAQVRDTIERNGLAKFQVHEIAVGAEKGVCYLNSTTGETGWNEGMNFVTQGQNQEAAIETPVVSLNDFCADEDISHIDLLKIDVQGNEPAVLKGAAKLLEKGKIGYLFVELNWDEDGEGAAAAVIKTLSGYGYRFAIPTPHPVFKTAGEWMNGQCDIVATRQMSE